MKRLLFVALASILIGFTSMGAHNVVTTNNRVQLKEVQLKSTSAKLKTLEIKYDQINTQLDHAKTDDSSNSQKIQQLEQQLQQTDQEKRDLQSQLQAKIDAKNRVAAASQKAVDTVSGSTKAYAAPVTPSGGKYDWMAQAGIDPSDYAAVDYIVSHESGWNTTAVNASSGSCGLVQELPCGKSGCTFGDPVCQLRWASGYASSRYGGWWGAYSFWQANQWW